MKITFLLEDNKKNDNKSIVLFLNDKAKLAVASLDELRGMILQLEKVLGELEETGMNEEELHSGITAFFAPI